MASLSLKHIYKKYPGGVTAVSDFCLEIKDKEFIIFVGPSGCGKSTTLRMIAGLEEITEGELFIGDKLAALRHYRNMGLEFQHLLAPLIPETGHHAADDYNHGNAEHHTDYGNACDDRRYRAFRFQIF